MTIIHLDVLVEEPSAESASSILPPRIVPDVGFDIQVYEGRRNLLKKLPQRLIGYEKMARTASYGLVILVDRDRDDCRELTMINRIAREELES